MVTTVPETPSPGRQYTQVQSSTARVSAGVREGLRQPRRLVNEGTVDPRAGGSPGSKRGGPGAGSGGRSRSGAQGRRRGSRLHAAGFRRQNLQAVVLQGQAGRGAGLVPEGVHA